MLNTKGILVDHVAPSAIADVLANDYGAFDVHVDHGEDARSSVLHFLERAPSLAKRSLFVSVSMDAGMAVTHINMTDLSDSREIVRLLVKRFGGRYLPSDSAEKPAWEHIAVVSAAA